MCAYSVSTLPTPPLPVTHLSRISGVDFVLRQPVCSFPALVGPLLWASPFLGLHLPSLPKGALSGVSMCFLLFVGFLESLDDSETQKLRWLGAGCDGKPVVEGQSQPSKWCLEKWSSGAT